MSVFNRLFTGQGLKRLSLIIFVCLLGATIWFLGPLLGFGEVLPLKPVENRVILLVVLFFILIACWYHLPIFISIALLSGAALWIIGPHLLFGKDYPLKDTAPRFAGLTIILTVTLLCALWRLLRALSANPALLDKFVKNKNKTVAPASQRGVMHAVIKEGINYIKRIQRNAPLWKRFLFVSNRQRLPWFIVMGTPGAGKTTMLFSSGQEFPLPEQLNRKDKENPPTAHCECLFTNNALFLDTSGKYTSSDDDSAQQEWDLLVQTIKKNQLDCSVNGVLLVLSAEDILHKDKAELLTIAATLRARLYELRHQTGEHFPVYFTVTKLDLLCGFDEYFRNLTTAEREQVWGVTLPWQRGTVITTAALLETLNSEFSFLVERLSSVMYLRQQEEYEVNDRKKMYALPQDFQLLTQGVIEIVKNIFIASRYDDTQFNSTLRGVYFISSCQAGVVSLLNNNTLLRKWNNLIMHETPATPASIVDKKDKVGLVNQSIWGKSYFLTTLFSDIIVQDKDLFSYNRPLQTSYWLKNVVSHILVWSFGVILMMGFSTSFQLNQGYLKSIFGSVDLLGKKVSGYIKHPENKLLPGLLSATQSLPSYQGLDVEHPQFSWRYGLYTADDISTGSNKLYHYFLLNYLLPQLEVESGKALLSAIQSDDEIRIWQNLKLYLMLSGQGNINKKWMIKEIVKLWSDNDFIESYASTNDFVHHLNEIFDIPQWKHQAKKPDTNLISEARSALNKTSATLRIWQQLKSRMMKDFPEKITLDQLAEKSSPQLFSLEDRSGVSDGIPGIYSREAWNSLVKKKFLTELVTLQHEDEWVSGGRKKIKNLLAQREEIMTLYFQEYTNHWKDFLSDIQLSSFSDGSRRSPDMPFNIGLLRVIVQSNSPLITLLNNIVQQTTLQPDKKTLTEKLDLKIQHSRTVETAKRITRNISENEKKLVRQYVDDHFNALRVFVKGQTQSGPSAGGQFSASATPLTRLMGRLNDQYAQLVIYNDALKDGDTLPANEATARLIAESRTWPDPVKNIISPLLTRSAAKLKTSAIARSVESIGKGPGETCRMLLQGRYPFSASQRNVRLVDFEHFFAAGGIVDSWFSQNLADKVDTSSHPWRFKGSMDTRDLSFFERVDRIRNTFLTADNGKKLAFNFSVSIRYISPSITQFSLDIDGKKINYAHGPLTTQFFSWPGSARGTFISMMAYDKPVTTVKPVITQQNDRWDALRWLDDKNKQPHRPLANPHHASANLNYQGPWAILRWLDSAEKISNLQDGSQLLSWNIGSGRVDMQIEGLDASAGSPTEVLHSFHCPGDFYN
ncbi:hypothetical protein BL250_11800 [Erwinia sp. OLTSP20]|uniref:type VI secretion system membrane subunit TssM n=1 Tax=unclassified Erwinia TaxID=2622719 RepID=UPI000C17D3D6|nr:MULTISPECIES: type VI secretion system membrane subunit TssM [unclassified Erwinia]PIJ49618.1 hypothetical protein BV501_12180 [Erwinia sp. OAMSP11]PIJ71615.1 hypothetical protein BK416_11410 [Erwinia sp. OLSSP12]PIJ82685.1 hypothetical protein BLD47_06175 [Erwinia sp. OLCASP19]PIJ83152.1 hypothetical protein BLD46_10270 [Erwinia sp. OLMTSP26]PIJ85318.1 hypothetical protein BLD49_10830 [Erwinia sp. OLMDSP33]